MFEKSMNTHIIVFQYVCIFRTLNIQEAKLFYAYGESFCVLGRVDYHFRFLIDLSHIYTFVIKFIQM